MFWLLAWAAVIRLPRIVSGLMLFGFDQGRDALATLHLVKTLNPVFIGPWTSIPGLFFGPGWYYLLAPAYWLTQGHPLAGAGTMFILGLAGIILAYKFLGTYEAIILTAAPLWFQLSTNAGNALPMALIGLLLVIALKQGWPAGWLGVILGLGWHFSSALAVLWLLVIPWLVKPKHWLKLALGLFLTFIPQLLFELKHNWSQTLSVIDYFIAGESQQISPGKIALVTQSIIHELNLAIFPDISRLWPIGLLIIIIGAFKLPKIGMLILVPAIGFWFLHYNPWYVYGLAPLAVALTAKTLRLLPKPLAYLLLLLLLISSLFQPSRTENHKGFFNTKMQALDYIYSQAGDQPFSSYHYHPEIYDYAYQYLYIWQAFKGKPLPVEFSYQPGVPVYVPEKNGLLARLRQDSGGQAKLIFLIIERPDNIYHYPFESWLKNIPYSEIITKKTIGPELEVWQVLPSSN